MAARLLDMTEKISLQLELVLPGIPDERDSCIERLTEQLQAQGLDKAHVVQEDGKPVLCLHYDPTHFTLQQVRRLAESSGAKMSVRYQHELMRIDGITDSTIHFTHTGWVKAPFAAMSQTSNRTHF